MIQLSPSGFGVGLQPGCVGAVLWFGEAERHRAFPGDQRLGPQAALFVGAEAFHHDHLREVADDRGFVLQVVVQAEPLVRQMFPDDGHVHVGAVATAERRRQSVAQPARPVGSPAHLGEQILPLARRDTVVVPIRARMLSALVEVLHVVGLQRSDLAIDESIYLGE